MKADKDLKIRINNIPYVMNIPKNYKEFEEKIRFYGATELCIFLKRMREYNSFIADYSKKEIYIELFKFILTKCDNMIKDLSYERLEEDLKYIEVFYKHIYEMSSALPEVYLDYIRNKLKAYVAIIKKLDKDIEDESNEQFPKFLQKDIFFFLRICTRIMGTEKNLKILQTILFVVSNIIDKVKANTFSDCSFLLCVSSLLIEDVANKVGIQGKYMPCVLSSMSKILKFINSSEIPSKVMKEKISIVDLFVYDKLDSSSVSAFINGTGNLVKSLDLLYSNSEYKDYIMPLCESCASGSSECKTSTLSECLNSVLSSSKFLKHLNKDLLPLIQPGKTGKSILQLQKIQAIPIKTFKTEKEFFSKEANDEKRLKRDFKKAYRDAKREIKKDTQMLHELRNEESEKRYKRDQLERKKMRRVLNDEQAEFKLMQTQEAPQEKKIKAKNYKNGRMAGNKTDAK